MLLGLEFKLMGCLLAELKEGAELIAELGESLEEVELIWKRYWVCVHPFIS